MFETLIWLVRRPFEYIGILAEAEPQLTEQEKRLMKSLREFFEEKLEVYKERKGHVTMVSNNSIQLNHRWDYHLHDYENFGVGDYVSWKEYKEGQDGVVIRDVVLVGEQCSFQTKIIDRAKLVKMDGPKCETESGVIFYLDKVRCDLAFRPVLFDFLSIECTYVKEEDEEFDLDPACVHVKKVSPSSPKLVTGKITQWDPSTLTGLVNEDIVFHQNVCEQVVPSIGATVVCDCVKGEYDGGYRWRVYNMKKNDTSKVPNKTQFFDVEPIPQFDIVFGESKTLELCVTNRSNDRPCRIKGVDFMMYNKKVEIEHGLKLPYQIPPQTTVSWPVKVKGDKLGRRELKVVWNIANKGYPINTRISYHTVQEPHLKESEVNHRRRAPLVVPGRRRMRNPVFRRVPIREYPVPERIRDICAVDSNMDLIETQITLNRDFPFLAECLSPANYGEHMHTLLYLEEIAESKTFERLATRASLIRASDCVVFNFPADSDYTKVVCGDRVRASKPWEHVKYEANVWAIYPTRLCLKFSDSFESTMPSGAQFDLEFLLNRLPHRRRHQAVDLVLQSLGPEWLFPNEHFPEIEDPKHIDLWYNPDLNKEQRSAVKNIMAKNNLPYPYIIYGPPGTGKTMTVVESILQMITLEDDYRILVTAPTNSAVDTLGIRLLEFGVIDKEEMVRLSSYNAYSSGQIAVELMDISLVPNLGDPAHDAPVLREGDDVPTLYLDGLGKYRILLGTLSTVSYLNCAGVAKGFFTHIIIDEAGQCTEPDSLLPIALVQPKKTQLVLAGDPQQLGPTIASVLAKQYSFDQSFLDRLTRAYLYRKNPGDFKDTHGYNPVLITKLVCNYRSLPKIVDVVGSIFYGGDLRPTISEKDSREARVLRSITIHGIQLGVDRDSMLFINVNTPEEQIEGSMSWMNHGEVAQVFFLLNFLYNAKVSPDDIGVITPYSLQKKKIYEYLDGVGAMSPKVASVEEFQGQERDIVILSLVRNNLGISKRLSPFVTDAHRVNVALSRARVLNIIIGNRNTLMADPLWARILSKCRLHNVVPTFPDPD